MAGNNGSRPGKRGGPRPGAGAPRGNLNALKHGANSHQIEQLSIALSLVPEARVALARLARRQRRHQARARTVAVSILTNLLKASLQALENNQPPGASITFVPDTPPRPKRRTSRNINQTTQPDPQSQSNPALPSPSKGEGQGEGTN